jgi:predicted RNA binding protein YcfA (HicA-like mRNA interferase family)
LDCLNDSHAPDNHEGVGAVPQVFEEDRQSGSHLVLRHEEKSITVTLPLHTGCDLGRGLAAKILKDAGFTIEDYLRLR